MIFLRKIEVLAQYQRRYDFYLTDESQDTSPVQHAIIEKLVAVHQNLCVVADEDQAIYSWRGAEPDYLLNFQKIYPEAHVLLMTQNYRSSASIVEPANLFIQRNKNDITNKCLHKILQQSQSHLKSRELQFTG